MPKLREQKTMKIANDREHNSTNRYFLMRHGESLSNRRGLIVSKPEHALNDYGLTSIGAEQVLTAALNTRLDRETLIITSDYLRALETAQIMKNVVDCEAQVQLEPRLRERDFGQLELKSHDNYESVWLNDLTHPEQSFMSIESVQDVLKRTQEVLNELDEKYHNRTILLVGHGDPLQILLAFHNGINPRFHRSLRGIANADIRSLVSSSLSARNPAA